MFIGDLYDGQLTFPGGIFPASYEAFALKDEVNLALVIAGIFLTCFVLISLGFFIGLVKSTLTAKKQVPYLGFVIDMELQALPLLPHKNKEFIHLVKGTLGREALDLLTLQRLSGKYASMRLAVQGASVMLIILFWLFLETWEGFLPWRSERDT